MLNEKYDYSNWGHASGLHNTFLQFISATMFLNTDSSLIITSIGSECNKQHQINLNLFCTRFEFLIIT